MQSLGCASETWQADSKFQNRNEMKEENFGKILNID